MGVETVAAVAGPAVLNAAFGGGGGQTSAQIPRDLQGPRAQQIALLQYLLGFGPQPGSPQAWQGQPPQSGPPGASGAPGRRTGDPMPTGGGGVGTDFGTGGWLDRAAGGGSAGGFTPDFSDPTGRLEQFFGGLGMPTTGLQTQSMDAIGNMLRQPAPEQRALDMSSPALQGILGGKPGQGIIDALQPTFERNLASANQTGARFGSANAVLRSRALDDFNLLGANAAQQGINQQINASQALGMLSQAAGQNPFDRAQGAFQTGSQYAGQLDVETQRRLQLLMQLLSTMQSATLGAPTATSPSTFQNLSSGALTGAQIYELVNPPGNTTQSGGG